ncbi:MAG: CRTAC1 family protein, partial [Planctomycetota bacterium]
MAELMEQLRRPFEALMWRAIAATYRGDAGQVVPGLNQQRLALLEDPPKRDEDWLLCGVKRQTAKANEALNELRRDAPSRRPISESLKDYPSQIPVFSDVAQQQGIDGRFLNGEEQILMPRLIHHGIGGGVAVIDYDLDGFADLYFPQGASIPDQWQGKQPNDLYRNLGNGDGFQRVTDASSADDRGFSQGATAGDFNADGFPDLYIANIGRNTLLINNGDGTFRNASDQIQDARSVWTTSVAIADLNGDHFPELIDVNYVDDPIIFVDTQPDEDGNYAPVLMPRPGDFQAASDDVAINQGDGTAIVQSLSLPGGEEPADGLALLVTDIDGQGGNEIFVANDMRPNHYWVRSDTGDAFSMTESAVIRGCAFSGKGNANACMGIAVGDYNESGLLDFAVTNFFKEPMNFYQQQQPGQFVDASAKQNLYEPALSVNGFGTQALDYDNNSRLDIAVVNGHVHDNRSEEIPFRMQPQLFDGSAKRFSEVAVEDASGYWSTPTLARGLAKLDYNRDGRIDLVVTHLDHRHALLENQTRAAGNWLQLRLVGTESERDAIGATIQLQIGDRVLTDAVCTGDGFESRNEAIVSFGLGDVAIIDRLTIRYPSGKQQVHEDLNANHRYLLVEGQPPHRY